jgi:hypothetical protein
VLGGDEVYVCAVEAAAVVKVVMWRTRQSPKVLELEVAPHSCLAHAVIGASSLSRLHLRGLFTVFTTINVNTTKLANNSTEDGIL